MHSPCIRMRFRCRPDHNCPLTRKTWSAPSFEVTALVLRSSLPHLMMQYAVKGRLLVVSLEHFRT